MKKKSEKILVSFLCLVIFFNTCALNVSAGEISRITLLGDSISKGYGLKEDEKNYGQWLGEYFGAEVSNYAASGKTTQELIDQLSSESEVTESVKDADIICVSIGGNDLLDFIFDDLFNAAQNYSSSSGGTIGLSPESVQNMIISISTAIGPASVAAGENTAVIADMLNELNPDAKLIFQTIYNPFETNNPDFKEILPPLYTFASIYLASVNRPLMKNEKIICADIKAKFKGLCPFLTNMNRLDIHPNKTGHIIIAEEIIQLLKIPGNYSVFSDPFSDMTDGSPADIPDALKEETAMLSDGKFRKEEIPAETAALKLKQKETAAETAESSTNKTPVEKETEPESESAFNTAIIIDAAAAALLLAVIIFAAAKHRKKRKERRNQK